MYIYMYIYLYIYIYMRINTPQSPGPKAPNSTSNPSLLGPKMPEKRQA